MIQKRHQAADNLKMRSTSLEDCNAFLFNDNRQAWAYFSQGRAGFVVSVPALRRERTHISDCLSLGVALVHRALKTDVNGLDGEGGEGRVVKGRCEAVCLE
ncbi:hypothetical protein EYF80_015819 [Liparis tanakae]|uniref:Uncharacterized protein n=1 Tax=Liparis tanakae TaxID=230148 RepID=A0A4Z2I7S6_9TELE|nr:hypothetical protein EYF80_015819 [Liparis tanakae]